LADLLLLFLSAGLILASWFLSLGYFASSLFFHCKTPLFTSFVFKFCFTHYRVENAEVLCLGLVSAAVVMLVLPLFKATGGILLQMAPPSIPSSALSKCLRQVSSHKGFHSFAMIRV